MKKFLGIIILCLLSGCAYNSDGSPLMGKEGGTLFYVSAGHPELVTYFSKFPVDEICHKWHVFEDYSSDIRIKTRKAMKEVLVMKSVDPLFCMKVPSS